MEWSDLRVFLAIAREGTLGGAARRTGQTQPTMGRRLKALEEAMGTTLFHRTSEGFVLTEQGAAVLPHAERMEEEALSLQREVSGKTRDLSGLIRVSSSDWFGLHVLSPVLASFSLAFPRIIVELVTDSRLLSLARREADVVFRIRPFSEADVISRRLLRIDYGLYARADDEVGDLGDGSRHRLVTMDEAFGGMPDVEWAREVLPNAQIVARSNNRDVQASLCAHGAGIAILPRPLGDARADLKRLPFDRTPPSRDTYLGYHKDLRRSPRLRALLDHVVKRLSR
ncbi:LysR family transcriptional regulator [Rhizobium sp. S96]|uniref:LysR family transcriptional regulator n=1 Tax=Rhizobium sp. S96 TaxID=3055140 RepID=UPI0025AA7EAC|nr:LysR family transcriptional regulator [Rhizobium sp. S96]MDM9620359.1 LysR family transcriptional regulator [Rhizobium sp. S96]